MFNDNNSEGKKLFTDRKELETLAKLFIHTKKTLESPSEIAARERNAKVSEYATKRTENGDKKNAVVEPAVVVNIVVILVVIIAVVLVVVVVVVVIFVFCLNPVRSRPFP